MHALSSADPALSAEPVDLRLRDVGVLPIVLPQHDAMRAVEEAAFWLQAYRQGGPEDVRRVYEVVEGVDAMVQPFRLRLMRDYLAEGGRMQTYRQRRMWHAAVSYASELGLAYTYCLKPVGTPTATKELVASIAARAVRAIALELRWTLLAYSAPDPTLWGRLGCLYRDCERSGVATLRFKVYPAASTLSTVRREYLRALILAVSGMNNLLPAAQAAAERIIAALAELFILRQSPAPGCHFVVDIDQGTAPQRGYAVQRVRDSHRYFGPGDAGQVLAAYARQGREKGQLPSELGLPADSDVETGVAVLEHLSRYWGIRPPERSEARTRVLATMHAAAGVDAAFLALTGERPEETTESWIVADESRHGVGAVVRMHDDDALFIGQLVALHPERAGPWAVGAIRRLDAKDALYRSVGVHLFGRGAVIAAISDGDAEPQPAILLPVPTEGVGITSEVVLVMRTPALHAQPILHLHGHRYRMQFRARLESGEGYFANRFALSATAG